MSFLRTLLIASIVLLAGQRVHAQNILDILPQDAAVAIAVHDLDDLIKKGDKLLADTEIKVPFRPSALFGLASNFLGINAGLDRKKPAAILLLAPEKEEDRLGGSNINELIIPVLPFTDADAMTGNFGFKKDALAINAIEPTMRNNFGKFATRTKDYFYLSDSRTSLKRIQKAKPLGDALSPEQRKIIDQDDILLHIGPYTWQREFSLREDIVRKIKPGDDPAEKQFVEIFAEGLKEVKHGLIGFRIKDGIDGQFVAVVPKDGKAAMLLALVRGKRPPSTLAGLPDGNVLFAQASSGHGAQHALIAKALFSFVLEDILVREKFLAQTDLSTYLGVLHEVWSRLQGNRVAVYQNADETKHGLFSAIAVLDSDDPHGFLREMRTLARMAVAETLDWSKPEIKGEIDIAALVKDLSSSSYAVRNSATTKLALIGEPALPYLRKAIDDKELAIEALRRCQALHQSIGDVAAARRKELLADKNKPLFLRPTLTFVSNAEKRLGQSIDVIDIKIAGLDNVYKQQFIQLLGRDWDKVRIAIVGKQIVMMLGSETEQFDQAMRNLQKGVPGLAATKRLAEFNERAAKDRLFEFHVSVEGILRLIAEKADVGRQPELTSASLSFGTNSLQLDARVPTGEVRALARQVQAGLLK
jgi:hypothetical protein